MQDSFLILGGGTDESVRSWLCTQILISESPIESGCLTSVQSLLVQIHDICNRFVRLETSFTSMLPLPSLD